MYKLSLIDKISLLLLILGGLNWGLFGLFNIDLAALIFGSSVSMIAKIIYIIIGVSALDILLLIFKGKKKENNKNTQ